MKHILSVGLLLSLSTLYGMAPTPKKLKRPEPALQKIWRLRDFNRIVMENNPTLVEDYLETYRPKPQQLSTALHAALEVSAAGSVALLLRYGVPTNLPDNKGDLAITKMTALGNGEMV